MARWLRLIAPHTGKTRFRPGSGAIPGTAIQDSSSGFSNKIKICCISMLKEKQKKQSSKKRTALLGCTPPGLPHSWLTSGNANLSVPNIHNLPCSRTVPLKAFRPTFWMKWSETWAWWAGRDRGQGEDVGPRLCPRWLLEQQALGESLQGSSPITCGVTFPAAPVHE